MTIYSIAGNKFAVGTIGSKAAYVFRGTKNIKGVRGRRPTLTKDNAKKVAATPEMKAFLKDKLTA